MESAQTQSSLVATATAFVVKRTVVATGGVPAQRRRMVEIVNERNVKQFQGNMSNSQCPFDMNKCCLCAQLGRQAR